MELTAQVHNEDGSYWAEVVELPGCFASGATLDELAEALDEAAHLWLEDDSPRGGSPAAAVEQLKLVMSDSAAG